MSREHRYAFMAFTAGETLMGVRLVLTGLAILAMTTACGLLGDDGDVRLDHSTATALPPLPDTARAEGALTEAWHVDTFAGETGTATAARMSARLVGGQLFVAHPSGLDVYDARTGRPRWHYREPDRTLSDFAVTAGMFVARTGEPGESPGRWVGLDAATGRIRWTAEDDGIPFRQDQAEMVAGAGVVPVMDIDGAASDEVRAIDARTGRTRWKRRVAERGCEADPGDQGEGGESDGSLFAVDESCVGSQHRVILLNPADGRQRWARDLARDPQVETVIVRTGAVLFAGTGAPILYSADGRELVGQDPSRRCDGHCELQVTGGRAVITYGARASTILITDLSTGKTSTRPVQEQPSSLTVAAGSVYGFRQIAAPALPGGSALLPAGIDVIDPVAATVRTRPLPFGTDWGFAHIGLDPVRWQAVADGRLYVLLAGGRSATRS